MSERSHGPDDPAQAQALPRDLFVLSDLHLAAGQAPVTGRVDPGENFFEDASFGRFLRGVLGASGHGGTEAAAEAAGGAEGAGPLLVLNGDTFDFTRLVRVPRGDGELRAWAAAARRAGLPEALTRPDALRARIGPRERRFGLGTSALEAVWKVRVMAAGHPAFFQALSGWVGAGGRVLFIRGNHDLELHWPAVRRALLLAIAAGDGSLEAPEALVEATRARVSFEDHGRAFANVWLEHGHRFEATTRVAGGASAAGDPGDPADPAGSEGLRLPLGSLVNIYLLNPIERWRPLLDNIKPVERALWAVFRYAPVATLGVLYRGAMWLPRALRSYHLLGRSTAALAVYLASVALLWLTALGASSVTVLAVAGLLPAVTTWVGERLPWFLLALLLLWPAVGLARDLWRRLRPSASEVYSSAACAAAVAALGATGAERLYAVVGHTHGQDARLYPRPGGAEAATRGQANPTPGEVVVLNTGTWIPVVDTSLPGAAAASPRTRRPFVHLTLTQAPGGAPVYVHRHLQWDDARGEPAPSLLVARE